MKGTTGMEKRRIGIIGGTFNPIHYAHLFVAECAREQFGLDRVIFIPSGESYFKRDQEIPSGEIRYQLVKKATEDNPFFKVSRIEIDRPGDTYTIETLEQLSDMYPGDELFFIVGADTLYQIDKWVRFEDVLKACTILAAVRDDTDEEDLLKRIDELIKMVPGTNVEVIKMGQIDISSTMIRDRVRSNKSIKYLLPDSCIEYIALKGLYTDGNNSDDIMDAPDKIIP